MTDCKGAKVAATFAATGAALFFISLASPVSAQGRAAHKAAPKRQTAFAPSVQASEAADAALAKGVDAYKTGDFGGAVIAFTEALAKRPQLADAFFDRGLAYADNKQWARAEADFTAYCRARPRVMDGYIERGRARRAQHHFGDALADFSYVISQKSPPNHEVAAPPSSVYWQAFLERAATQYAGKEVSSPDAAARGAAYVSVLAEYDAALSQLGLHHHYAEIALFNRALVTEAQAADPMLTPANEAANRYEAVAAGYALFSKSALKAPGDPEARAVESHILQINTWLRGDKSGPRPTPPASFVLKEAW